MDITTFAPNVTTNGTINGTGGIFPKPDPSRQILNILITVMLAIIMIGMGCAVELPKVIKHLKKPSGVIVGFFCQFVIMPSIAFGLAKAFQMPEPETLALLILGACPGGSTSNIAAYWIDGDMDLSITMTTVSSTLGLGMMPLLLYIYTLGFDQSMVVPFETLGITLAALIVPIALGMIIRWRFPRHAEKLVKILSILGAIAIIVVAVISIVTFNGVWSILPSQIVCAAIFPAIGMILGYTISSIISLIPRIRLHHYQRRTVSLETGVQNTQLAISIIQLSGFTLQETGRMILFPVIYLVSQAAWIVIIIIVFVVYKRKCKKEEFSDGMKAPEGKFKQQGDSHTYGNVNLTFDQNEKSNEKVTGNSAF
ncbi:ileal sodium/bile acid cotransporter-like [Ciona intestinalis]